MAWSYHLFPVSCLTDFNLAIEVGGGGGKQKYSQLRVAVLENYYFLLDKSLSDNFHIAQGFFFMRYLGHGGKFLLLQSDDEVK